MDSVSRAFAQLGYCPTKVFSIKDITFTEMYSSRQIMINKCSVIIG